MSTNSPPPFTFLQLARELRDQIYDAALVAVLEKPPQSITADESDRPRWRRGIEQPIEWRWRLPLPRGSCYGLTYSCRQIQSEVLECIQRQNGLSFELNTVIGMCNPEDPVYHPMYGLRAQIWPMWTRFPLREVPRALTTPGHWDEGATATGTCRNLHVIFRVQSEANFRWQENGSVSQTTRSLFIMLARFLLYGPLGLHVTPESSHNWNIDTLSVDITGAGTTFANPWSGQSRTVPLEVVEDVELHLTYWLETLSVSGALSDRVRVVSLAVDGEIKRSWSIKEGERLHPLSKLVWVQYGWIVASEDIPVLDSVMTASSFRERRNLSRKLCCNVQ